MKFESSSCLPHVECGYNCTDVLRSEHGRTKIVNFFLLILRVGLISIRTQSVFGYGYVVCYDSNLAIGGPFLGES